MFDSLLLALIAAGAVFYAVSVAGAIFWVRHKRPPPSKYPPVTVLKPLYGMEKGLAENLRSICVQDYPDYQVVLSVQRRDDPAIPVMQAVAGQMPEGRVTLNISDRPPQLNGKVENLMSALVQARNDMIVISDSDVRVPPDYLRKLAPVAAQSDVGSVSTLYRASDARRLQEKLELLTINADYLPYVIFAAMTHAANFCLGASTAFRREVLARIGGFESLRATMVEDAEMGRRIAASGLSTRIIPEFVELIVDLPRWRDWWVHQVYWDQNARFVHLPGYIGLLALKFVPLAVLFAFLRLFDPLGLAVLAGAAIARVLFAAVFLRFVLRDREGLRVVWLMPLRDVLSVFHWLAALCSGSFERRGIRFGVSGEGRVISGR